MEVPNVQLVLGLLKLVAEDLDAQSKLLCLDYGVLSLRQEVHDPLVLGLVDLQGQAVHGVERVPIASIG